MSGSCSPIQAIGLCKLLGGRMVLRGIGLEISAGECVALTGGNGAGKTTLLRCLAALVRPTAGEVRWFGQPAASHPRQRRTVGMVAHEGRLYAHLTVRENLVFAARMWGIVAPRARADMLLEQVGMLEAAERQTRQVSKGMRQRLAIVRALLHEPPILLLDEPFAGLDASGREWLARWLRQQKSQGRAIALATHDPNHARQLADRAIDLGGGVSHGRRLQVAC